MRLFVTTHNGRKLTLKGEGTDDIESLLGQIYEADDAAHPGLQRLVHQDGRVLEAGKTLADYGLRHEDELRLGLRPAAQEIELRVGGVRHPTVLETLLNAPPGSRLHAMFEGMAHGLPPCFPPPDGGGAPGPDGVVEGLPPRLQPVGPLPRGPDTDGRAYHLIDRDGISFGYILNYLRAGTVALPHCTERLQQLAIEARYFGITELAEMCARVAATPGAVQIHDAESPDYLGTNVTISFAETDVRYNDDVDNLCGWQLVAHAHAPSGDTRNKLSWYTALHKPATEFAGNYGETWRIESAGGGLFHIISTGRNHVGCPETDCCVTPGWALSCHADPGTPSDARNDGGSFYTMVHDGDQYFSKWRIDDVGGGCVRITLVWPGNKIDGWVLACHAHVPSGDTRSEASWKTMVHPSAADDPTPGSIWRISRAILQ